MTHQPAYTAFEDTWRGIFGRDMQPMSSSSTVILFRYPPTSWIR